MLDGEIRKTAACGMETFRTLESSKKTIAILGDRWRPQTAKQQGGKISKKFLILVYGGKT